MKLPYCHIDHPLYSEWVRLVEELESEGCTTSDAQSIADIEMEDKYKKETKL